MGSPGSLTFDSVGRLASGGAGVPVQFDFYGLTRTIDMFFGPHPRNGNVASTQYALPSQVFTQAQDGYPPFYCYSEPCIFNITSPGLPSDGNWWHLEAWQILSKHTIEWVSLLKSQKFKVFYSTNNGSQWEQIGTDFITGTWPLYSLEWDIPSVTRHKKNCLIKVNAYNANDRKVASIISAYPFRIETLEVTSPEEGTTFVSTEDLTITWATASTADPVHEVKLYYNHNNSTTWKMIDTIPGNPGTYTWTIPRIKHSWWRAYIKVVLKDDKGNTIGKNVSKHFHVNPPPPTQ